MTIAVLSGKGGTGKTTVAASLARIIPDSQYLDCDVEEPNGFIFLDPQFTEKIDVSVPVPLIDDSICTGCGDCCQICQFNALALVKEKVLLFPELCHHCGACLLACKPMAISEEDRVIGYIEKDEPSNIFQGCLYPGELVGIPIIQKLKTYIDRSRTAILDCPPGASCAVVQSLSSCDFALLVSEPTPFGLNDLAVAHELVKEMNIPAGLVLNKAESDNSIIEKYCSENDLPLLLSIPYSRQTAENYSRGQLPIAGNSQLIQSLQDMVARITREVRT